ncbi:MAG: DinB family protein, partial [Anaerolineales bacterium]|nr:DinB family protein [Anaerolineales bacterium]
MEPCIADLFERLRFLHAEISKAIQDLPVDALDWAPAPGANAMGALVVHLTGAERYWIGTVIGGEPSDRVRESEFLADGLAVFDLQQRLDDLDRLAPTVLGALSLDDLARPCRVPRDGRTVTVGWALAHTIEHTAVHVGHIQLTR